MASWANQIRAGSNTDATSYVTASVTVTTGKPIAFLVENSRASAAATPTLTVPSGVTATELGSVTFVGGARRLTLFWLVGSGSGTVTIDFGASTQTACIWSADEGTSASTTAPTGGDIVTNSGGSASSGSADLTSITSGNHVYAGVGTNTGITIDPGSGFTEVGTEASTTTPAMTITTEYRNASDDPTADFTFGAASSWAVIAIEVAPAVASTDLTIADAAHAHAADSLTLTQVHVLTVADAGHGHVADNLALTQVHSLTVADAAHGHAADNVTLTQAHNLTVADASHGHTADNVALSGAGDLGVQDASHAHSADNVDLTQQHQLAAADASHAHVADNVELTQVHVLSVSDASHGHTADGVAVTQTHVLVIAEGLHGHLADIVVLEVGGAIVNATSVSTVTAGGSSSSTVAGGSSVSTVSRAATSTSTVSDG